PFLNLPGVAPVFCFFFADPLISVLPCRLFKIFLQPLRILSSLLLMVHLNCFSSHMNLISASSSGSLHFNSTEEQSTTSGFRNKPLASLYSQSSGAGISSMQPCCLIRSMALFGPIPLMVPQ
uniref:Uncharacterized protein n=1 Tax=Sparus aurata TaxID=8175 RepID=A0A671ULE3_SPAAU